MCICKLFSITHSYQLYLTDPQNRQLILMQVTFTAHSENNKACFCGSYGLVRHVVQSSHAGAMYDYDSSSDRHSVMVPLDSPQPGSETVVVAYHFTCKTSCPQGMQRRPISIVFTLETSQ